MGFCFIQEAQCNVIPLASLKKLNPEPDLRPVRMKLPAYNNSKIPVLGKCSLILKHNKDHFDVSFKLTQNLCVF